MALFDTFNAGTLQAPVFGSGVNNPAATAPSLMAPSAMPVAGVPSAAPGGPANPMALISMLGMLAGAIGGPNTPGGRVGQGVQTAANGSMMAQAMLDREKGQRDFLSKLLAEHGKVKLSTDSILGLTPEQTGGVASGMGV